MGGEVRNVLEWWAERTDRDFDETTLDRLAAGEEAAIREVIEELDGESVVRVETGADGDGVAYTIDLAECLSRSADAAPAEADGGTHEPPAERSTDARDP